MIALCFLVQLMCPDCPLRLCLFDMQIHYRTTGHGRR
jgi:hypothetical protein